MEENSTKQRLLNTGIQLFAEYGYDQTSTRMIADHAGTNIASIAFHFGNKESFYETVLTYVANLIQSDYSSFEEQVTEAHKDRTPTPEEAWNLIEAYVDQVLSILTNTDTNKPYGNASILQLLSREQMRPANGEYPITNVLCKNAEAALNLLLMDYWQNADQKQAAIISRTITGAIISFGEHPIFIRRALGESDDAVLSDKVWNVLRTFILNSIRCYTPVKS